MSCNGLSYLLFLTLFLCNYLTIRIDGHVINSKVGMTNISHKDTVQQRDFIFEGEDLDLLECCKDIFYEIQQDDWCEESIKQRNFAWFKITSNFNSPHIAKFLFKCLLMELDLTDCCKKKKTPDVCLPLCNAKSPPTDRAVFGSHNCTANYPFPGLKWVDNMRECVKEDTRFANLRKWFVKECDIYDLAATLGKNVEIGLYNCKCYQDGTCKPPDEHGEYPDD